MRVNIDIYFRASRGGFGGKDARNDPEFAFNYVLVPPTAISDVENDGRQ